MRHNTSKGTTNTQLREARLQHGWSQQEVADLLGTTTNNVSRWELGQTTPGPYFRNKLCNLFEKSSQELGLQAQRTDSLHSLEQSQGGKEQFGEATIPGRWNIPFRRNPFFTGRDTLLSEIYQRFHTNTTTIPTIALCGLGGIGKTQLALEYAYRQRNQYSAVFWVEAENQSKLTSSFVSLADLLVLPEHTEEDQSKIVTAVLRWFNHHQDWLLIFDNVEDVADLKPFLPSNDQGALLLTTRLQTVGTVAPTAALAPMTMDEGTTFLLSRINHRRSHVASLLTAPQEQAAVEQIVAWMGGLPLALEQAGAYINATQCSLSDYRNLFQTGQQYLLHMHESSSDHPLSVSKTFALTFEHLVQHDQAATGILTLCAFLASEGIPERFILEALADPAFPVKAVVADSLQFLEAMKTLLSYSLVQRNADAHTITIHRLVQMVMKGYLPEKDQNAWVQHVLKTMYQLFPFDEQTQTDYWPLCEQLLPHALVCVESAEQWGKDWHLTISLAAHVATYLIKRARYNEAEMLLLHAIQVGEQALGLWDLSLADVLEGLATFYYEQGKYKQAEQLFQRVLQIREQGHNPEHVSVIEPLNKLGLLACEQGNYNQAETFYQRALHIAERSLGSNHPQLAYSLQGLGLFYWKQGNYSQAETHFGQALHIREQNQGPNHPQLAVILNGLGIIYSEQGKYSQAEGVYQRALHITEQELGLEHPEASYIFINLGAISYQQNKYTQAEEYYQRALHILEQAKGADHIDLAILLDNLAELYTTQGNYEQAKTLYLRSLNIRERELGSHHPSIAYSFQGLAGLYEKQNRYEESYDLYEQALALRQQCLGSDHPTVAEIWHGMAVLQQKQQKLAEALTFSQHALDIRQSTLGNDHPLTQETVELQQQLSQAIHASSPS